MQAAQMSNYLVTNTLPELMGNRSPTKSPTAADGFVQIVALREAHVKALFTLLGVADMYDTYSRAGHKGIAHTDEINAVIKPALLALQSSAHWISELGKLAIPCAPIQTLDEVAAEPQFDHRLIFTEIPNPQTPDASVKRSAPAMSANPHRQSATPHRASAKTTTTCSANWAIANMTSPNCGLSA